MKPKGLLVATVLLAVLAGVVWWSNRKEASASKTTDTSTKVLSIPEDQFQEIRIKKLTGEVINLRRDNSKWQITEPKPLPADQDAVSSMVTSLASLNADSSAAIRARRKRSQKRIVDLATCRSYRPLTPCLSWRLVFCAVEISFRFRDQTVIVDLPKFVTTDSNAFSRAARPGVRSR